MIGIEQLANDFNSLLKYFSRVLGNHKNFSRIYFINEIIANKNFPEYGIIAFINIAK